MASPSSFYFQVHISIVLSLDMIQFCNSCTDPRSFVRGVHPSLTSFFFYIIIIIIIIIIINLVDEGEGESKYHYKRADCGPTLNTGSVAL